MNYKIKLFFINCILLSCLSLIIIKAIPNYFYNSKQESITFFDQNEYEQEWLLTQQPLKRYDFNIYNKNDIIKILKDNNNNCNFSSSFDSNKPGYNCYESQSLGTYWFKDPPNGLITVYFKYRDNPFNQKYPVAHYKHTLDDLLKHKISISEAYIFWDVTQATRSQQVIIPYEDNSNSFLKCLKRFVSFNSRNY